MSPEAEELLKNFLSRMSDEGKLYCANMQSIAFQELQEHGMFSKVTYNREDGWVRLSTKAIHYFEEKEAQQKSLEEQGLNEKKAERSKLLHDILIVFIGAMLAFLFQLLASAIFPKA